MPPVEWLRSARRDDDLTQIGTHRLLNCYRERAGDEFVVKSVLGTEAFADLDGLFMQAMSEIAGTLHVVHGGKVFSIASDGTVTEVATVSAGNAVIEGNNGNITVTAGGTFYNIAADGTVTTPSLSEVSSAGSLFFIGQRTVVTESGGRQFQWSDAADPTTFGSLNFATAESRDDNIVRGVAVNNQAFLFGERSTERWYVSGAASSTQFLLPVSGATIDIGLKAFGLLAEFPGGIFFVGNDGIVYVLSGGQIQPVSTRGVETSIAQGSPLTCVYYEDEGHKFCGIVFEDRPAWIFDVSLNEWHERASGSEYGAWDVRAIATAYGFGFVGNDLGRIYRMRRNNVDADGPLFRRGVSGVLENDGKRFTLSRFMARAVMGRSSVTNAPGEKSVVPEGGGDSLLTLEEGTSPRAPHVSFRFSKDGGETWGKEKVRSFGNSGDYNNTVTVRSLGQFRRATVEFQMSDPADVSIACIGMVDMT